MTRGSRFRCAVARPDPVTTQMVPKGFVLSLLSRAGSEFAAEALLRGLEVNA